MQHLADLGIFFPGLGVLLLSFGFFWFVDCYSKKDVGQADQAGS